MANARTRLLVLLSLGACGTVSKSEDGGGSGAREDASTYFDAAMFDATPIDASIDACISAEEVCNGVDDDCNGVIDEGFDGTSLPCDGADSDKCEDGVTVCLPDGSATMCSDDTTSSLELCNGEDDDCDGETDEDFDLGQSCDGPGDTDSCADGVKVCGADGAGVCDDSGPDRIELCDGLDNDCDGSTDEGYPVGQSCDGPDGDACIDDVRVCNGGGTGTVCEDRGPPIIELCNGFDDDCDGINNEDYPVGQDCDGADTDVCLLGSYVCDSTQGGVECVESQHRFEICNGLDDDCDGLIDDGFEGIPDRCNGLDDDCDGPVDEDASCPDDLVCQNGQCRCPPSGCQ